MRGDRDFFRSNVLAACRSASALVPLGAALFLAAAPVRANNAGCCVYKDANGVLTCATTTLPACRRLIMPPGGGFIRNRVCGAAPLGPRCVPGVACLACSGGADDGALCETGNDCTGLCLAECQEPGCVTLDEQTPTDTDGDGIADFSDNCPLVSNPTQADSNNDGFGDACEPCRMQPTGSDTQRPSCVIVANRPGPPEQIDIRVTDGGSGLTGIDVLVGTNASIALPLFDVPTNLPQIVTATKLNPTLAARVELRAIDFAGNCTFCDPVLTTMIRGRGRPATETHEGLAQSEDTVTITNGSPGLRNLEIVVNGTTFRVNGLADGGTRSIDIAAALLPGNGNAVVLTSHGKPGTSASVLIWDGEGE
jgi:hypothetical protein